MSNSNGVSISEISEKITKSYGFFCLIDEGKKVSVVVDNERSIKMIGDYLIAHPELLDKIIAQIKSYKASLN